jgi:putative peptidoglycan lipid II flippase
MSERGGGRAGLARSSAAVAVGTLLSRVTGLARVGFLIWALVGTNRLSDTYNLGNTMPNILYELLLGGILTATLVPIFVGSIEKRDTRAISAVFTIALTAITIFTVVTMALSPLIARLLASHDSGGAATHAARVHLLVLFLLCFLPQMVFYGFTALASALLNAHRRFVAAAYAPVVNNVVVIAMLTIFALRTRDDRNRLLDLARVRNDNSLMLLLGVGTTLGIIAMAAVLMPALRRARVRLSPVFAWRDPTVITMLRLSGWTVGYVVANEIAQVFVLVLAYPHAGYASAYLYAFTFYQVPQGLLAVSIMTTMTPELARRVAANDMPGLRRDFDLGVRYLVVLVLPASVLFACLAQPMIGILSHGVFAADNAAMTADVLQAFAISSVPLALYLYTLRGFYALRDTRTPFVINCFENALNIAFALALYPALGVQGLALAWSAAYLISAGVALVALRRRIGEIPGRSVGPAVGKAAIGTVALAIVTIPLAAAIGRSTPSRALLATAAAAAAGGVVYIAVLAVTRSEELRSLLDLVRRRGAMPVDVSP